MWNQTSFYAHSKTSQQQTNPDLSTKGHLNYQNYVFYPSDSIIVANFSHFCYWIRFVNKANCSNCSHIKTSSFNLSNFKVLVWLEVNIWTHLMARKGFIVELHSVSIYFVIEMAIELLDFKFDLDLQSSSILKTGTFLIHLLKKSFFCYQICYWGFQSLKKLVCDLRLYSLQ